MVLPFPSLLFPTEAMTVEASSDQAIVFLVFAVFSTLCSFGAAGFIAKHGNLRSNASKLLIYLHVSLLMEEVSSFPYAFSSNSALCKVMGWLHILSSLMNIFTMVSTRFAHTYI